MNESATADMPVIVTDAESVTTTNVLTIEQLSDDERAVLTRQLDRVRRSRETSLKWVQDSLARAEKALETVAEDTAPAALRNLTARRLLTAAGVEWSIHWDDNLVVRLGHLKPSEVDAALAPLAKVLGRFDNDSKSVNVTEVDGRKVLDVELPAARWPVIVRFTTPSSKKYTCRIVKQVRHEVVCTPVGEE